MTPKKEWAYQHGHHAGLRALPVEGVRLPPEIMADYRRGYADGLAERAKLPPTPEKIEVIFGDGNEPLSLPYRITLRADE